jgi:corrinoid protein of di/trimethylamine methyltransferase
VDELFDKMRLSILDGEEDDARELARQALSSGVDLMQAMDRGFIKGIQEAGDLFGEGKLYLPELVCAAEAMKTALEILNPELKKLSGGLKSKGTMAIVTVQGDIHEIGKTIVISMMNAVGFEVHDLGVNVRNEDVVRTVMETKPDVLGLSALLTTTMEEQRRVINMLTKEGYRDKVKVVVGGAPVSRSWAEQIGADAYAADAVDCVKVVSELLAR